MEVFKVDPRQTTAEEHAEGVRQAQVLFKLNHTMPFTDEYYALVRELFGENLGEGATVMNGLTGVCFDRVHIGKNVMIMNNCLMMSRGGITIEDGAMIAANVQLIANNHDLQDRTILVCKPVHICRNAWIGAGATILPGVTVGENAVVAAGAVVTKDVAPGTIVGGNPAKFIKNV
ncbi:MAG: acyltransferase [Bacteroidales bacterium]|nr:acyltransferase [Bacteroidales bacterium]